MTQTNQNKDGCSQQKVEIWSHWKLSIFKNENLTYELLSFCKYFIRLKNLSSIHVKCVCEVAIFLKNKN